MVSMSSFVSVVNLNMPFGGSSLTDDLIIFISQTKNPTFIAYAELSLLW